MYFQGHSQEPLPVELGDGDQKILLSVKNWVEIVLNFSIDTMLDDSSLELFNQTVRSILAACARSYGVSMFTKRILTDTSEMSETQHILANRLVAQLDKLIFKSITQFNTHSSDRTSPKNVNQCSSNKHKPVTRGKFFSPPSEKLSPATHSASPFNFHNHSVSNIKQNNGNIVPQPLIGDKGGFNEDSPAPRVSQLKIADIPSTPSSFSHSSSTKSFSAKYSLKKLTSNIQNKIQSTADQSTFKSNLKPFSNEQHSSGPHRLIDVNREPMERQEIFQSSHERKDEHYSSLTSTNERDSQILTKHSSKSRVTEHDPLLPSHGDARAFHEARRLRSELIEHQIHCMNSRRSFALIRIIMLSWSEYTAARIRDQALALLSFRHLRLRLLTKVFCEWRTKTDLIIARRLSTQSIRINLLRICFKSWKDISARNRIVREGSTSAHRHHSQQIQRSLMNFNDTSHKYDLQNENTGDYNRLPPHICECIDSNNEKALESQSSARMFGESWFDRVSRLDKKVVEVISRQSRRNHSENNDLSSSFEDNSQRRFLPNCRPQQLTSRDDGFHDTLNSVDIPPLSSRINFYAPNLHQESMYKGSMNDNKLSSSHQNKMYTEEDQVEGYPLQTFNNKGFSLNSHTNCGWEDFEISQGFQQNSYYNNQAYFGAYPTCDMLRKQNKEESGNHSNYCGIQNGNNYHSKQSNNENNTRKNRNILLEPCIPPPAISARSTERGEQNSHYNHLAGDNALHNNIYRDSSNSAGNIIEKALLLSTTTNSRSNRHFNNYNSSSNHSVVDLPPNSSRSHSGSLTSNHHTAQPVSARTLHAANLVDIPSITDRQQNTNLPVGSIACLRTAPLSAHATPTPFTSSSTDSRLPHEIGTIRAVSSNGLTPRLSLPLASRPKPPILPPSSFNRPSTPSLLPFPMMLSAYPSKQNTIQKEKKKAEKSPKELLNIISSVPVNGLDYIPAAEIIHKNLNGLRANSPPPPQSAAHSRSPTLSVSHAQVAPSLLEQTVVFTASHHIRPSTVKERSPPLPTPLTDGIKVLGGTNSTYLTTQFTKKTQRESAQQHSNSNSATIKQLELLETGGNTQENEFADGNTIPIQFGLKSELSLTDSTTFTPPPTLPKHTSGSRINPIVQVGKPPMNQIGSPIARNVFGRRRSSPSMIKSIEVSPIVHIKAVSVRPRSSSNERPRKVVWR